MFTVFLLLAACKQEAVSEKVGDTSPSTQQNLQKSQNEPVSQSKNPGEKERMTSLNQVVSLLTAKNGTPWTSFDAVPGVQWRDTSPKANSDSTDPENAQYRSGTLLLDGFGPVDVPDGDQGAEGGAKQANEGESGITLNGDAQTVQSIAVKKFYASPEYAEVLKRQLPMATAVRLIADTCAGDGDGGPDPLQTKFYAIGLDTGEAFVEAYLDDGTETRGPGFTTFVFTKTKPQKRIQALQCKES
ncbi:MULTISPECIES: hypothetical protein [Xanthomonas]|uniref:Lipoprotein n=1 Tax=Xanthomonas dyei TaxID=743699 RepID=A0ABZ0D3Z1_9XANT|nr:hypothetical protein [Xanthomonas dyei]MCC4635327.1 hypothetical protein [Xanthomonas dyei pv. eucalypti]WOB24954.1 hypothetical protein NYR99_14320 [Xanthomonas dyei]WOB52581.1 hypothetical protein NYR95_14325 [Xanthomonas dyei]